MTTKRGRFPVRIPVAALAILLAATALRLAVAWPGLSCDTMRFIRPDTPGYLVPAAILAREGVYPGTGRVPGFPAVAALVFGFSSSGDLVGFDLRPLVVLLCVVGGLAAMTVFFAGLCRSFRVGVAAGAFYACNLTAVANAPMLLSDTLFGFTAALQFLFFMLFWEKKRRRCFFPMVLFSGLGVMIRPINILWIFPALALLVLCMDNGFSLWGKIKYAIAGAAIFCCVTFPWMIRNVYQGAGFTPDTNTGAVYHQNGAMLAAEVNGTDFATEKARLLLESEIEFADAARYSGEASREAWRLRRYREQIFKHPFIWMRQSATWRILIPDAPTFWELLGRTFSGRGTMGVLSKYGLVAAVRHYFGDRVKIMLFSVLLLLPTLLLYACALGRIVCDICGLRRRWYELVVLLAFAEYYLLLPGAITAPRYQIPALPVLCVMAAAFIFAERSGDAADASAAGEPAKPSETSASGDPGMTSDVPASGEPVK